MVNTNYRYPPPQQLDPYGKLIQLGVQIGKDVTERINFYLDEYGFYSRCERLMHWLLEHPLASICIFMCLIACGIPIILFSVFAVTSVFMTFTGFLLIEGTILSIAILFLVGISMAIFSIILTGGAFLTSIYLTYSYVIKRIQAYQ
ncbi:uncharacterized protein LOC113391268 [Ctenocephalides felis]|uniref:uncharacterized protein LOC113363242 n=1 Tax=Ctenocephalides felis TaxID=7515 RepID=UPI000E6E272B|nr:uncharacterized protein LOC113363242 [Ctenocephalides felis]XP_026483001.1 uncharacterized protein LOC113391268 [Ctenocephalides felis]